jgi:hypothetical protein
MIVKVLQSEGDVDANVGGKAQGSLYAVKKMRSNNMLDGLSISVCREIGVRFYISLKSSKELDL